MYLNTSNTSNLTTVDSVSGLSVLDIKRLNYPKWGHQLIGTFLLFVGIFGVIENSLVLFTFYKAKQLRSATNYFIIGLAVGDLCMSALGNPLATTSALNGKWFHGEFFCYWEGFIVYTFGMSELYLLTAISVDRYIVIAKPLKAALVTKRVAFLSVLGCFGFGMLWSIFPFFGWSSYGLEAPGIYCGLLWEDTSISNTTYVVTITIFCFFLPFGVMIYCYYYIYMTIRNVNKNMVWDLKSRVARKNLRIEKRMLKSCIIMCSVYWFCWSPYAVMSFWQTFGNPDTIPLALTEIPAAAAKSQVVWNPIIYVATNKQFRKGFYASLPCAGLRDMLVRREEIQEGSSKQSDLGENTKKDVSMSQTIAAPNNMVAVISVNSTNPNAVTPGGVTKETLHNTVSTNATVEAGAGMPSVDC